MVDTVQNTAAGRTGSADRAIALWLLVCCAMVFVMVVLGGMTRLTHSGLSMVEWEPVTGFLPPMSEAGWQEAFDKYQQFPEYQKVNQGMDLSEFKSIFWFEFIHRLWGRTIGVVFLLPFLFFMARGHVSRSAMPDLARKLWLAFVLGGLQGVMGWYMVMSGLVDRPDVSQYRLTAHLGAAFLIYGYMFWLALGLLWPRQKNIVAEPLRKSWRGAVAVTALVAITVLSGGFVAGLDAGLIYNTFPMMGGGLVPEEFMTATPWWSNFFDNIPQVQFDHRVLAIITLIGVAMLWLAGRAAPIEPGRRIAFNGLAIAAVVQVGLGITTLLLVVPLPIAALHQMGALVLFTMALWVLHEIRRSVSTPRSIHG